MMVYVLKPPKFRGNTNNQTSDKQIRFNKILRVRRNHLKLVESTGGVPAKFESSDTPKNSVVSPDVFCPGLKVAAMGELLRTLESEVVESSLGITIGPHTKPVASGVLHQGN